MAVMDRLKAARKAGCPLVLITTPDQPAMIEGLRRGWNGNPPAIVGYDAAAGLQGLNPEGEAAIADVENPADLAIVGALRAGLGLPERSILILSNTHRIINDNTDAIQGVQNLREPFKGSERTLIMLAAVPTLPPELASDFLTIDDPLPAGDEIETILSEQVEAAGQAFTVEAPDQETIAKARGALLGLPRFPCEQSIALCLRQHNRIDPEDLYERKRAAIRQVKGLKPERGGVTFADIGGNRQIIKYATAWMQGYLPPWLIVIIEELEKSIAGYGKESTGTTDDAVGVLLTSMEDEGWSGIMEVGQPGAGKSLFGKALASTFGVQALTLDVGDTRGGILGQSEQYIRTVVKTLSALGANRVLFLASCNKLDAVPAALRRRFRGGIWYFDLPDEDEKRAIWPIQLKAYGLPLEAPRPDDTGWTGAEIRNCCELARQFGTSPAACAEYISPVSVSDPESVLRLQQAAHNRWLSTAYPGRYRLPAGPSASKTRTYQE